MSFHYGKHTLGYFTNANKLVADSPLAGKSLEEVFLAAGKDPKLTGIFNNAAQAWNHVFYWNGLAPGGARRRASWPRPSRPLSGAWTASKKP